MKNALRAACVIASLSAPFAFASDKGAPAPKPVPPPVAQVDPVARPTLEVVFVLDTTSSMGGLIEGAKEKIWSIASKMATGKPTPRIRVGLVGFRDRGDAYITQRFDLTEDLDAVYKNLQAFRAEGGGDGPEHVGQALGEAVKLMAWSEDKKTAKMIFLVGDAPPHDDYQDGWNTRTWAKNAIAKGIVVNTVRCGSQGGTEEHFKAIAALADGRFDSIQQSGGMVAVATPFDAELSKLNTAVADTSVYGGSADVRQEGERFKAEQKAMAPSASADRLSYRTNAGLEASGGRYDRDDLTRAPEKVASLKDEQLPENLRKLPMAERVEFLKQQAQTRAQLEQQVLKVSKQRDEWVSKNAKAGADSFDGRVFESVKRKAADVGVRY